MAKKFKVMASNAKEPDGKCIPKSMRKSVESACGEKKTVKSGRQSLKPHSEWSNESASRYSLMNGKTGDIENGNDKAKLIRKCKAMSDPAWVEDNMLGGIIFNNDAQNKADLESLDSSCTKKLVKSSKGLTVPKSKRKSVKASYDVDWDSDSSIMQAVQDYITDNYGIGAALDVQHVNYVNGDDFAVDCFMDGAQVESEFFFYLEENDKPIADLVRSQNMHGIDGNDFVIQFYKYQNQIYAPQIDIDKYSGNFGQKAYNRLTDLVKRFESACINTYQEINENIGDFLAQFDTDSIQSSKLVKKSVKAAKYNDNNYVVMYELYINGKTTDIEFDSEDEAYKQAERLATDKGTEVKIYKCFYDAKNDELKFVDSEWYDTVMPNAINSSKSVKKFGVKASKSAKRRVAATKNVYDVLSDFKHLKQAINDYYYREFGDDSEADFSNSKNIALGYTTYGDNDEWELRLTADLENRKLIYTVIYPDGKYATNEERYNDFADMAEAIEDASFDDLMSLQYFPDLDEDIYLQASCGKKTKAVKSSMSMRNAAKKTIKASDQDNTSDLQMYGDSIKDNIKSIANKYGYNVPYAPKVGRTQIFFDGYYGDVRCISFELNEIYNKNADVNKLDKALAKFFRNSGYSYEIVDTTRKPLGTKVLSIYEDSKSSKTKTVKASATKKFKKSSATKKQIFEFLDDLGMYADYNQKIEDLVEEFGLTPELAESYVWDWSSGLNKVYSSTKNAVNASIDSEYDTQVLAYIADYITDNYPIWVSVDYVVYDGPNDWSVDIFADSQMVANDFVFFLEENNKYLRDRLEEAGILWDVISAQEYHFQFYPYQEQWSAPYIEIDNTVLNSFGDTSEVESALMEEIADYRSIILNYLPEINNSLDSILADYDSGITASTEVNAELQLSRDKSDRKKYNWSDNKNSITNIDEYVKDLADGVIERFPNLTYDISDEAITFTDENGTVVYIQPIDEIVPEKDDLEDDILELGDALQNELSEADWRKQAEEEFDAHYEDDPDYATRAIQLSEDIGEVDIDDLEYVTGEDDEPADMGYGFDSNGDPIDESTVEELYRIAEYEILPKSELAKIDEYVSIDEDSWDFYMSSPHVTEKFYIHFKLTEKDINFNDYTLPDGKMFPDFNYYTAVLDFDIYAENGEITSVILEDKKIYRPDGAFDDYDVKQFDDIYNVEALINYVEHLAADTVKDIYNGTTNL